MRIRHKGIVSGIVLMLMVALFPTMQINVSATGLPPVANDDSYSVDEGGTLNVAAPGVLGNDNDVEGDPLTAVLNSGPSYASSFTLNSDGSFDYVHDDSETTSDSFTYHANDGSANSNVATVTITVDPINDPPVADAGGPYTGFEGSYITFDASGSYDPEGDTIVYNWDFDGNGIPYFREWQTDPTATHMWIDDYYGNVMVFVTDYVDYVDDTTTVTVYNVAPTITSFIGLPSDPIEIGATVGLTSTFTDPGILDTHTAIFDWGDGTISPGIVTETDGCGTATDTHTYTEAGVHTVTLTITDKDGGIDIEIFQYVVVYDPSDPSSGFVTGGGWIDSPAGAYRADPTLTGTANFGFVSKYKKGQSTPTGNTEFQYQIANLNFHSNNYDLMVVAGAKVMYKGTGTINGGGNYGFKIFAIDEKLTPSTDVDTFRIKIWDKDDNDSIVYDNDLEENGTELSGGQIVIHKN